MNLDMTLYLVTDSLDYSEENFLNIIEQACIGGITLLQIREKKIGGKAFLDLAYKVKKITDKYNIPLIIDDRVDIALAVDADGVHVGAEDIPVKKAREILGGNKIVGATAKTVKDAVAAYNDGADYIGTGAIYPTTTKVITKITEVSTLNDICKAVPIPVVAIGGLNFDNMDILNNSPIDGISVVSAIMKSKQPEKAAADLKEKVLKIVENNKG